MLLLPSKAFSFKFSQKQNRILKLLRENGRSVHSPPVCSFYLLYHLGKFLMHTPLGTDGLSFCTEEKKSLTHCIKHNKKLFVEW